MNQYVPFYSQLKANAESSFPSLKKAPEVSWDHLVSPHTLKLPQKIYDKVEAAVRALYGLSRRDSYRRQLRFHDRFPQTVPHDSVLMAYDFHTTAEGDAKLVEINTNASGFLFAGLMNTTHASQKFLHSTYDQELKRSFEQEGLKPRSRVQIVDDNLAEQKMYAEFLMYRDLLSIWGMNASIREAAAVQPGDADFIYNRSTDFYLEEPAHQRLRDLWQSGSAIVSPQPTEYFLLADKNRLVDFTQPGWLKQAGANESELAAVSEILIPSFEKKDFADANEIWSQRKGLFFKPKQAYGGKSVYRGESVSKKVFDRLMSEDVLIQKFVPAERFPVPTGDPLEHWKFDVRFFVYRDRIQQVAARSYQGQVTNFHTPLGGFTKIEFV